MPDPSNSNGNATAGQRSPDGGDPRLVAQMTDGDNAQPLSISEISSMLKRTVEDRFGFVRLRGEISGFKRAASGHVYLALKDDKAVIDGVIWRGNAGKLGFAPEDGVEVIASGRLTTYPGRSKYQIVIESMELAGEGALMQLFEKLKAKLAADGLFAEEKKRALPFLPRTIGVVTSPTGSVIRDILHRLADRCATHVIVWPVRVQGEGAKDEVAAAVRGFSALPETGPVVRPDLVIVARGGGSIEDLWAFNEEVVVRAIAESTIPVISAVGHETDTTLADYAADRRAPTPTAAAEIAVPVRAELAAYLDEMRLRTGRAVRRKAELSGERLTAQARMLPPLDRLLEPHRQRIDDMGDRLRRGLSLSISEARGRLADRAGALRPALLTQKLRAAGRELAALSRIADQLNPLQLLKRGYAWVTTADGTTVTSSQSASSHTRLDLHFADGKLGVSVGEGPAASARATPKRPKAARSKAKPADKDQPKLL